MAVVHPERESMKSIPDHTLGYSDMERLGIGGRGSKAAEEVGASLIDDAQSYTPHMPGGSFTETAGDGPGDCTVLWGINWFAK